MAHIIYTPDDNSPYNSDSEHHSVDDLQSAYERRQNVQERQFIAVNVWRKKVIFSAILLIVSSGFLLFSEIWYANVVGIAGAFMGIYGAFQRNTEFVFVYMVLLSLEFIKNIGIFIYYIQKPLHIHPLLLLTVCCVEQIVVVPMSMYYAFKLYRSLGLKNTEEIF